VEVQTEACDGKVVDVDTEKLEELEPLILEMVEAAKPSKDWNDALGMLSISADQIKQSITGADCYMTGFAGINEPEKV